MKVRGALLLRRQKIPHCLNEMTPPMPGVKDICGALVRCLLYIRWAVISLCALLFREGGGQKGPPEDCKP